MASAERQPSLNRKNTLFFGSDRGGNWAATMFTICQSCRLVDLDPYQYLVEIFAQLHTGRTDYVNLRSKAWAKIGQWWHELVTSRQGWTLTERIRELTFFYSHPIPQGLILLQIAVKTAKISLELTHHKRRLLPMLALE